MKRIDRITCWILEKAMAFLGFFLHGSALDIDWEDEEQKIIVANDARRMMLTHVLPFALFLVAIIGLVALTIWANSDP